jgi:hypothetical protein
MIRKTGDTYYDRTFFQNSIRPKPQLKTSSSEFQIILIHYDKSSCKNLQDAHPARRNDASKDEKS